MRVRAKGRCIMPTPERVFSNRKIVAKGNLLPVEEFKFMYGKDNLKLNDRKMKRVVERAEGYLDYVFPILPISLYRRYYTDGDRTQYQKLYFPRRDALIFLSMAEMYERKGRFTSKLIDVIWAILEETTWLIPAHFRSSIDCQDGIPNFFEDMRMHDISLFAASTAALLSMVYVNCADILDEVSPKIRRRIKKEVQTRTIKPYIMKSWHWSGHNGQPMRSNWLTWITENVLTAGAVFADDMATRETLVQRAMNSLDTFMASYSPDGGCDEGPGYWGAAAGSLIDCLDLLYDLSGGKINIFDHPLIKAMGEYVVDVNIYETTVVNFADAGRNAGSHSSSHLRRFAERCGSEVVLSYADERNLARGFDISSSHPYRSLNAIYEEDIEPSEAHPVVAKDAVYYDGIKIAMLREKPVRGEGMFLGMKGGHNAECHNHNDVGGFLVYSDKTPIIIDIGPGEYINWSFMTREKCWYKDSDFHTLPTFDGKMQKVGASRASKNEVFSAEEKFFEVEISSAWGEDSGINSYTRRGAVVPGAVVITDTIDLEREMDIDYGFVTVKKPIIDGDKVILDADKCMTVNVPVEFSVEEHDTKYPGVSNWGNENNVLYRLHAKLRAKSETIVFTIG